MSRSKDLPFLEKLRTRLRAQVLTLEKRASAVRDSPDRKKANNAISALRIAQARLKLAEKSIFQLTGSNE